MLLLRKPERRRAHWSGKVAIKIPPVCNTMREFCVSGEALYEYHHHVLSVAAVVGQGD